MQVSKIQHQRYFSLMSYYSLLSSYPSMSFKVIRFSAADEAVVHHIFINFPLEKRIRLLIDISIILQKTTGPLATTLS